MRPISLKLGLIVASACAGGCSLDAQSQGTGDVSHAPAGDPGATPPGGAGATAHGGSGASATYAGPGASGELAALSGSTIAAPRLVAPLSASRAGTRPKLAWLLPPGTSGARVEICADRGCALVEQSIDAQGTSAAPRLDLLPGVHYWRARGLDAKGHPGSAASAVWEVFVQARVTASATGAVPDFDGDGHGDATLIQQNGTPVLLTYAGTALGLAAAPASTIAVPVTGDQSLTSIAAAGDVDGDGYPDLLASLGSGDDAHSQVLVFPGGRRGLASKPSVALSRPTADPGDFGFAVGAAGDVNGDGYADVFVKDFGVQSGGVTADRIDVYLGSAKGPGAKPATVLAGPSGATMLDAAPAGDVNGDGYADLVVHDQRYLLSLVELYLGGASGIAPTPSAVLQASDKSFVATFGAQAFGAGDVNGDGYDDVVVYAPRAGNAATTAPAFEILLFTGGAKGLAAAPAVTITPPLDVTVDEQATLAPAGDVNGDGFDDLVVTVIGAPAAPSAAQPVLVYAGSPAGLLAQPIERLLNPGLTPLTGVGYGRWLAALGDVNGDGVDDLLVGPYDRLVYSPQSMIGVAFLDRTLFAYLGTHLGLAQTGATPLYSTNVSFGASIAAGR